MQNYVVPHAPDKSKPSNKEVPSPTQKQLELASRFHNLWDKVGRYVEWERDPGILSFHFIEKKRQRKQLQMYAPNCCEFYAERGFHLLTLYLYWRRECFDKDCLKQGQIKEDGLQSILKFDTWMKKNQNNPKHNQQPNMVFLKPWLAAVTKGLNKANLEVKVEMSAEDILRKLVSEKDKEKDIDKKSQPVLKESMLRMLCESRPGVNADFLVSALVDDPNGDIAAGYLEGLVPDKITQSQFESLMKVIQGKKFEEGK